MIAGVGQGDHVALDPGGELRGGTEQLPGDVRAVRLDDHADRCPPLPGRRRHDRRRARRAAVVSGRRTQVPAHRERVDGHPDLVGQRSGEHALEAVGRMQPHRADARGTRLGPPGPGTEVPRCERANPRAWDGGTPGRFRLAGLDETLGTRDHGRERHGELRPAVVVLASHVQLGVVEREVARTARERQAQ